MPADGGIIKIIEGVVGRVMESSGSRSLRIDPIATVGVPDPGVGVEAESTIELGIIIEG